MGCSNINRNIKKKLSLGAQKGNNLELVVVGADPGDPGARTPIGASGINYIAVI